MSQDTDEPVNTPLKMPVGYWVQPSCPICVHCYHQGFPDRGNAYFCIQDGVSPPQAPHGRYDEAAHDAYHVARDEWEAGREVEPAGKCPMFKPMPVS